MECPLQQKPAPTLISAESAAAATTSFLIYKLALYTVAATPHTNIAVMHGRWWSLVRPNPQLPDSTPHTYTHTLCTYRYLNIWTTFEYRYTFIVQTYVTANYVFRPYLQYTSGV